MVLYWSYDMWYRSTVCLGAVLLRKLHGEIHASSHVVFTNMVSDCLKVVLPAKQMKSIQCAKIIAYILTIERFFITNCWHQLSRRLTFSNTNYQIRIAWIFTILVSIFRCAVHHLILPFRKGMGTNLLWFLNIRVGHQGLHIKENH